WCMLQHPPLTPPSPFSFPTRRSSDLYVTMDNAGIGLFQDEKPKVFSPQGYCGEAVEYPAFYSSREVKEMGIDTTQVRSSRFAGVDRKSTRLNSSHVSISYAVFCLKKK